MEPKTVKKPRIAIIGAGPVGLEAALYARQQGFEVRVYERGRVGEHMHQWGHVRLFSPFGMNTTPLGREAIRKSFPDHTFPDENDYLTGREHVPAYLGPLAQVKELDGCIRAGTQVVQISRQHLLKEDSAGRPGRAQFPFRLLVHNSSHERIDTADMVFDCTGTYGQHRSLGEGGIPAPGELAANSYIGYWLDDILGEKKPHYAGKTTVVVGSGYSAATSICNLAELAKDHSNTRIIWLARTPAAEPIKRISNDPLPERDRIAVQANTLASRGDGILEFHPASLIQAIESLGHDSGFRVTATVGQSQQLFEVDRIIANVGYTPDANLYRELQVHECYASLGPMKLAAALLGGDCLQQTTHGTDTLRNPEPNFYILGVKSYGRNSNFLMRIGFEQVREVFSILEGAANG